MYTSATLLLVLVQCLVFITATPITNLKNLDTTLPARQVAAYYTADDSGALYSPGTGVAGTNSFRDDDGVYHDISTRSEDASEIIPRAAVAGRSRQLWVRAQAAVLQFLTSTKVKRSVVEEVIGEPQRMARRDEGEQKAPTGILQKIDEGEKIYF